jgi:hypothetical protein
MAKLLGLKLLGMVHWDTSVYVPSLHTQGLLFARESGQKSPAMQTAVRGMKVDVMGDQASDQSCRAG